MVYGYRCKLVNVVSGLPHGSVLDPRLFLMCTVELFSVVGNKLRGYASDFTLVVIVPSPAERVVVTESMNCDLNLVN